MVDKHGGDLYHTNVKGYHIMHMATMLPQKHKSADVLNYLMEKGFDERQAIKPQDA